MFRLAELNMGKWGSGGHLMNISTSTIGYPFWQYWIDVQDPRTIGWTLVDTNPYTILTIMSCYFYFCTKLGPALMKDRKPFELKNIMLAYNITMALTNATFVYFALFCTRWPLNDFRYPDRYDSSPQTMWQLSIAWWYCMSKFMDLFDTVFIVLKKKHETHASFLHMYHHTSVPIFGYVLMKHNAMVPALQLFVLLNGTIHTFMYSYYALATLGPSIQKYLWWKRYITVAQLIQFMVLIIYGVILAFNQQGYPKFWLYFAFLQFVLFYKLFYDFYKRTYSVKSSSKSSRKLAIIDANHNEMEHKKNN